MDTNLSKGGVRFGVWQDLAGRMENGVTSGGSEEKKRWSRTGFSVGLGGPT